MKTLKRMKLLNLALLTSTLLTASGSAEIPAGSQVPTSHDYAEKEKAFLTRTVLEPYRKHRTKGTGDDPAEEFLQLWIEHAAKGFRNQDNTPLLAMGAKAAKAGVEDPMFCFCYGRILQYEGKNQESIEHLQKAYDNLADAGYDVSQRCWAASVLALVLRNTGRAGDAIPVAKAEVDFIINTLAEGPYRPDEQRILYQHLLWQLDNLPIERLEKVAEAVEADNRVDPWMRHMVLGKLKTRQAWLARGGGWASEVTEEGWKRFAEFMGEAYTHLTAAWELNNKAPEPAAELIAVAMAGHASPGETPRFWFDRAVTAQMDFDLAYRNYRHSLLPRWGGSQQAMYAFGRECLGTGRFDTNVPYQFVEIVEWIINDLRDDFDIFKVPGVYDDLRACADGYLAEPSMGWHHRWYLSLKVAGAVRAGKWDQAREFLDATTWEPHETAFVRLGLQPDRAVGEVYARTGESAAATDEANRLLEAGKLAEAEAEFRKLLAETRAPREAAGYLQSRIDDAAFRRQLAQGDWVSVLPDAKLSGWHVREGNWSVDENGRLVGKANSDGLLLLFDRRIGTRFEIRGQAAFLSSQHGEFNIGVYFGQATGIMPNSFRFDRSDRYAAVMDYYDPLEKKNVAVEETNRFLVQRWDNTLSAYLNGELVAEGVAIDSYGEDGNEAVGIGGSYWYDGPVIAFETLEIRQLNQPPSTVSQ